MCNQQLYLAPLMPTGKLNRPSTPSTPQLGQPRISFFTASLAEAATRRQHDAYWPTTRWARDAAITRVTPCMPLKGFQSPLNGLKHSSHPPRPPRCSSAPDGMRCSALSEPSLSWGASPLQMLIFSPCSSSRMATPLRSTT